MHQYVKGLTTNYEDGFTVEMSTDFLSTPAKDEPSKDYMNAQIPNRAPPKGKGKGRDKSKDDTATPVPEGLALHTPICFPGDPYLQPEIPLCVFTPTVLGRFGQQAFPAARFLRSQQDSLR